MVLTAANDINGFASGSGTLADVNLLGFNQVNGTTITGAAVSNADIELLTLLKLMVFSLTQPLTVVPLLKLLQSMRKLMSMAAATATTQLRLEIDLQLLT